ncbi:MAG TPA: threonine ammonia-lyase [Gaiellaceae bacterium]|nr:threonine ammonia-lyase [Gaiellaceae bacterium]
MTTKTTPTLADIQAARTRLARHVRLTPVMTSESLERETGRPALLKGENLQRTGSFKIRGAANCMAMLTPEQHAAGVIAASAGNHGQAVAWAARELGMRATIFMPEDAPMAKVEPTLTYGGEAVLEGANFDEALALALARVEQTGAAFVHAFEDEHVIAGQGTIGLELAEQVEELGTVLIPVGGGGLAAGIAIALRALRPDVRLVGVEVRRNGYTIADGIAVKKPGELTMEILGRLLDDLVTVDDNEISDAITLLLERSKLLVEGAGAVGVAALLAGKAGGSGPVCSVVSGGNIDPTMLMSVLRHGMTVEGRYLAMRTRLFDRPGELIKVCQLVAGERGNIVQIEHRREGVHLEVGDVGLDLTVVMRNEEHCRRLIATLEKNGFPIERLR